MQNNVECTRYSGEKMTHVGPDVSARVQHLNSDPGQQALMNVVLSVSFGWVPIIFVAIF